MINIIIIVIIHDVFPWSFSDLRGAPLLGVQILLFSCSFQQKKLENNRFWELAPRPGKTPGSATDDGFMTVRDGFFSKTISTKRPCIPLFDQSENQIHYEILFL